MDGCTHESATGYSRAAFGDNKLMVCDVCGWLFFSVLGADGISECVGVEERVVRLAADNEALRALVHSLANEDLHDHNQDVWMMGLIQEARRLLAGGSRPSTETET